MPVDLGLARLSDNLLFVAVVCYSLAMLGYAAEFAFRRRRRPNPCVAAPARAGAGRRRRRRRSPVPSPIRRRPAAPDPARPRSSSAAGTVTGRRRGPARWLPGGGGSDRAALAGKIAVALTIVGLAGPCRLARRPRPGDPSGALGQHVRVLLGDLPGRGDDVPGAHGPPAGALSRCVRHVAGGLLPGPGRQGALHLGRPAGPGAQLVLDQDSCGGGDHRQRHLHGRRRDDRAVPVQGALGAPAARALPRRAGPGVPGSPS